MRPAAEKRPSRPCLLVVDEDSLFRWSLREKFAAAGWDVLEAGAGFTALDVCAERDVELALVAVTLPDLDGAALCARLSATHPACRVVLMSSAEPPDVLASSPAGLPVLEKPFDLDELVARAARELAETG